jgi:ABC-2 type transport system permease protein
LFALFYATESPDAWPARIGSFVPISAPFVIPVRAAVSSVAIWEVALAVAIMLASTYAVIRIAARV